MGVRMGPTRKLVVDLSLFVKRCQVRDLAVLPEVTFGDVDVAFLTVCSGVEPGRPLRAGRVLNFDSGDLLCRTLAYGDRLIVMKIPAKPAFALLDPERLPEPFLDPARTALGQ